MYSLKELTEYFEQIVIDEKSRNKFITLIKIAKTHAKANEKLRIYNEIEPLMISLKAHLTDLKQSEIDNRDWFIETIETTINSIMSKLKQ